MSRDGAGGIVLSNQCQGAWTKTLTTKVQRDTRPAPLVNKASAINCHYYYYYHYHCLDFLPFFPTLPPTAPLLCSTATVTTVSALVNTTTTEGENRWSQKGYLLLLVRLTTSRQVLLSKRKDPQRANGGRRRRKCLPSRKSANGHDKYQKSNGVP